MPLNATVTRYEFLPDDALDAASDDDVRVAAARRAGAVVAVVWDGADRWVITPGEWHPRRVWCENLDRWIHDRPADDRDASFIATTRYDEATALELAARLANSQEAA